MARIDLIDGNLWNNTAREGGQRGCLAVDRTCAAIWDSRSRQYSPKKVVVRLPATNAAQLQNTDTPL